MTFPQTRRRLLATMALVAGTGPFYGSRSFAAEAKLETTTVRLPKHAGICVSPQYLANEFLSAEGFTEIRHIEVPVAQTDSLARGEIDFDINYASNFIRGIDAGQPITLLGGIMVGCFELFGSDTVRSVSDLKGKSLGVQALGSNPHALLTLITAQIGLDPKTEIRWVADPKVKPIELFSAGKIDAFLGFPPEPQELRARKMGHVLLNTAQDRPWSQYFCCLVGGNREYVRRNPVATKRVLRAFLKATDLCATEPTRAAKGLVDGGFTPRYDYALQTFQDNPYDRWREYDAEDTVRFYALRLLDVGFIKSNPQKIIGEATDWRFLNELKRELKA